MSDKKFGEVLWILDDNLPKVVFECFRCDEMTKGLGCCLKCDKPTYKIAEYTGTIISIDRYCPLMMNPNACNLYEQAPSCGLCKGARHER